MHKSLERELVKKYPDLYKEYGGDITKTCMGWGMSCGDGWFKIIDELSADLSKYGVVAAQVKEKFGSLRFYLGGVDGDKYDEVYALIDKAGALSAKTCERCGAPAEIKGQQWRRCECDECEKKGDLFGKLQSGDYLYKIIEPNQIVVFKDDEELFNGSMSDFIDTVKHHLRIRKV